MAPVLDEIQNRKDKNIKNGKTKNLRFFENKYFQILKTIRYQLKILMFFCSSILQY